MIRAIAVTLVALVSVSTLPGETPASIARSTPSVPAASSAADAYGKLPLTFEINQGQTNASVEYISHAQGYTLALSPGQAAFALARSGAKTGLDVSPVLTMGLAGSNPHASATHEDKRLTQTSYIVGNDPAQWHTGITNYGRIHYSGVYPGIDLVYYGNQRHLEHDFIVAPNADPNQIVLAFTGAGRISVDHTTGDLVLKTSQGEIRLHKPISYQQTGQQPQGERTSIPSSYKLLAHHRVAFQLGSYDHAQPLVIDPVLTYSTYLGGTGSSDIPTGDAVNAIAVDASGNAYVAGYTQSADFPVSSGAFQTTNHAASQAPHQNAFVSKLNATGTALIYSTYLGGSDSTDSYGPDSATSLAIDSDGNAYVAGFTSSADFPTTSGALQTVNYNQQATVPASTGFVTKLNPSGTALVYSTYLGGHAQYNNGIGDQVLGLAIDSAGDAFVTGVTPSSDFPITADAFQKTGTFDFTANFVTKINPTGTSLIYSTYLSSSPEITTGTIGNFSVLSIAVDQLGSAYIAGNTYDSNFPVTAGAFDTRWTYTGQDYEYPVPFVAKLDPAGSNLVYATYFGGISGNGDLVTALRIDSDGNAFLGGQAGSYKFPIVGGLLETAAPDGSGFVAKLNSTGTAVDFSTFIGGDNSAVTALAIDSDGNTFVTGTAYTQNLAITPDGTFLAKRGGFLAKLNSSGDAIDYATMFGGSGGIYGYDKAYAIAVNSSGTAFYAGVSTSSDMPVTSGAFQTTNKKAYPWAFNAFVTAVPLASETTGHLLSQITLASSASAFAQGSAGTVTAAISSTSPEVATGSITFFPAPSSPNSFPAQTVDLDGTGKAAFNASSLAEGKYIAYATYTGDATHLSVNSINQSAGTITFNVDGAAAGATWVPFTPSSVLYFQVALSDFESGVQVTDAAGDPISGVSVSFSGTGFGFNPATVITDSNGNALTDVTVHKAGNLTLIATIQGVAAPVTHPLQVIPGGLTVTVGFNARTYGAPNPTFSYQISGLVGSDTVTVIPATISGPSASNYTLTVIPGTLLVTKAPLRLQPPAYPVRYGQPIPALDRYNLSGFVNGDTQASTVTGAPVLTTTATSASPAGIYPVHIAPGTLNSSDYTFVPFTGDLQIYKAPLTLHPASYTIHVGDSFPAVAYTISGFANGDTQATSLTGAPVFTTNAPSLTRPGRYYIIANQGTLSGPNYVFELPSAATNGILTILP